MNNSHSKGYTDSKRHVDFPNKTFIDLSWIFLCVPFPIILLLKNLSYPEQWSTCSHFIMTLFVCPASQTTLENNIRLLSIICAFLIG